MRAVTVDHFHMRAEWHLVTKDGQHGATFDYATTKCMLSLKAHDQHSVSRVRSPLRQMVQNSPALRHAGCCDDHHGAMHFGEGFRLFDITRVAYQLETEQVANRAYQIFPVIEHVRVHFEHGR